jgi:diguanylate cyclase
VVTRYGGEEFTVLLVNCGLTEAVNAAERIRAMVESHEFGIRNRDVIKITVSIGVSSYPETTAVEEKLIEQADIALYNAKRSGRNRVCIAEACE